MSPGVVVDGLKYASLQASTFLIAFKSLLRKISSFLYACRRADCMSWRQLTSNSKHSVGD